MTAATAVKPDGGFKDWINVLVGPDTICRSPKGTIASPQEVPP
jgi:hypothetical protein